MLSKLSNGVVDKTTLARIIEQIRDRLCTPVTCVTLLRV